MLLHRYNKMRSGFSLIELLIVMALIVLLASLTLPSFRGMVRGQRTTQAVRLVQSIIEVARSRAIANGRPVAVIFERISDPSVDAAFNLVSDNTSTRMSIGEVFPPYEGDWSGATGDLLDVLPLDGVPDTLSIQLGKVATLYNAAQSRFTGLIEEGDLLQLGDHSQTFTILNLTYVGGVVNVRFANPPPGVGVPDALWFGSTTDVRFRMTRRPSKVLSGSVVMPRGMCVDLSQSGSGAGGAQFAAAGRPLSFQDTYGPLYIVFNARGGVDGAYYKTHDSTGYEIEPVSAPGVYHILVGKVDQVVPGNFPPTPTPTERRDDIRPNLYDDSSFWVSINPYNGLIYSSPNMLVPAPSVPNNDRAPARTFAINVQSGQGT